MPKAKKVDIYNTGKMYNSGTEDININNKYAIIWSLLYI